LAGHAVRDGLIDSCLHGIPHNIAFDFGADGGIAASALRLRIVEGERFAQ
jgi:hypothetical protein